MPYPGVDYLGLTYDVIKANPLAQVGVSGGTFGTGWGDYGRKKMARMRRMMQRVS